MPPKTVQTTPSKGKPATARSAASPATTMYLTAYNTASALAWGYVLFRVLVHMSGGDGYTGIKEWAGLQGVSETFRKRATGAFDEVGDVVKRVQTAALLEAVHSATRLVRSPLGTTIAQIASRLALVWGVCEFFPQVARSPFYVSMVTAWSLAEIIRYTHYATGLQGIKIKALEWLRYTAFYVLYPVGAGSEAALIFFSAPHAKEQYGALAMYAVYILVAGWPPALAFLMSYMHSQRRKHVSSSSSSRSTHSTPRKTGVAPKDITSAVTPENVLPEAVGATPARSTRSKTRKSE